MNTPIITPLTKKLIVRFSGKNISLPHTIQKKVDNYWDSLIQESKTCDHGEILALEPVEKLTSCLKFKNFERESCKTRKNIEIF